MAHAELRPVAAGAWDAFTGGLRLWALVLAGMGVVLASAAASFAIHIEIERIGRLVWERLRKPARTWKGEIVRAVLLTAIGLLAALRPAATLQSLMVIAGALVAFEGLRELFMLVPPRRPQRAEDTVAEAREGDWEGSCAPPLSVSCRRPDRGPPRSPEALPDPASRRRNGTAL
jgi:hypothetical protein